MKIIKKKINFLISNHSYSVETLLNLIQNAYLYNLS